MIIRSLKLQNIRSYTSETVEFPEGSTLLSGDIGSGKSSILLAIEFALFGLKRKSLGGNSMLRNGKKEGSVELKFSIKDKDYIIKRTLKRQKDTITQTSGYIIVDKKKKELTPVELKDFILTILGYPKELLTKKDLIYRYTVYTPQEEMKQILLDDSANRLDTLRKVFGIDRYKRIKENSSILLKDLKEKKSKLEGHTIGLNEKTADKEKLSKDIHEMKNSLEGMQESLKNTSSETAQKKARLRELENKLHRYNNIKKDIEHTEKTVEEKKLRRTLIVKEIKELDDQIKKLHQKFSTIRLTQAPLKTEEQLEEDIKDKEGKLNGIIKDLELTKERLDNTKNNLNIQKTQVEEKTKKSELLILKRSQSAKLSEEIKSLKDIEKQIDTTLDQITKITTDINRKKIHIDNSKNIIEKIKRLDSCPTCLQEVDKTHRSKITEEENLKIKSNDSELNELTKLKDIKEKLIKDQKTKQKDLQEKQNTINLLNSDIQKLEEDTKDLVESKKAFNLSLETVKKLEERTKDLENTDTKTLEKTIANFKKLLYVIRDNKIKEKEKNYISSSVKDKESQRQKLHNEFTATSDLITESEKDLKDMKNNLKEFDNIEPRYRRHITIVEEQLNKEKGIEVRIAEFKKEIENIEKLISSLTQEIKEKQESKEKIQNISQMQNWLENYFISLMSVMEKHVMFSVYSQFDALFRDWFNKLIEEETISSRLDETLTPVIEQNGYETSIENLSGGERTSAALAYRLSLNKVVNNIVSTINTKDLIILDEPTDGFSSEQLDKVRDVLDELESRQIILVSHESKIESFVDNVIKISKNEHTSEVIT